MATQPSPATSSREGESRSIHGNWLLWRLVRHYIIPVTSLEFDWLILLRTESAAHVVEDLLPSVSYVFRVSAVNEVGVGAHSKPSAPVLLLNEPEYDSDSPSLLDDIRIKTSPFKMEYIFGREIAR